MRVPLHLTPAKMTTDLQSLFVPFTMVGLFHSLSNIFFLRVLHNADGSIKTGSMIRFCQDSFRESTECGQA